MTDPVRKLVVAALIRQGDDVLMSQRRADQGLPLHWEFPGGKIEPGEAPEDALVREIKEELGCQVAVEGIHEVVFHRYPHFDLYMLLYRCRIVAGTPHAVDVAAVEWVNRRAVKNRLLPPADVPIAERLAQDDGV